jgi:hypothetical protein
MVLLQERRTSVSTPFDDALRALLVCPDEYPGLRAESVLRSQGCAVWDCDDFREALALARQDPPDLLLYPAASLSARGVDLLLELQKRTRTSGIRVIAVCPPERPLFAPPATALRASASPKELVQILRSVRGAQRETPSRMRRRFASGGA